jgi:hypothetical protein
MTVNNEAIRKILKKYRKQMLKGIRKKQKEKAYFGVVLEKMSILNISNKTKQILQNIEQMLISHFYPKNPKSKRENLRKIKQGHEIKRSQLFAYGFFAGISFVLLLVLFTLNYNGHISP